MGLFRVFKRSIRFTTRSKRRFLVFLLIFAIVSTFVAFFVDGIDTKQTDEFLKQKGVVLDEISEFSVSYSQGSLLLDNILDLPNNGRSPIEDSASYHYADLDQTLRIFSFELDRPWMSSVVNPSLILTGRYPRLANEILVPKGSFQLRNSSSGITLKSDIVIGQSIEFDDNDTPIKLQVVGTFDNSKILIPLELKSQLWLFMDFTLFENVLDLYSKTLSDSFTYSMSIVVPGEVLNPTTYDAIETLKEEIDEIISAGTTSSYGTWWPSRALTEDEKNNSYKDLVSLGFAVVGGIVLSLMFSFLITRFRRREIAVLKALGYSNSSVRTTLIAEIIVTSVVGFVIGLGSAQGILFYFSGLNQSSLLRGISMLYSFIINVVIALPGMFLVSRRILKISPAEAFRDK
jgi:ABC-type antimicrobial peptide transport system permease subunit